MKKCTDYKKMPWILPNFNGLLDDIDMPEQTELDPEMAKALNDFCKTQGTKTPKKKRF